MNVVWYKIIIPPGVHYVQDGNVQLGNIDFP